MNILPERGKLLWAADAVGKHKRLLLNESRLEKYPWPEWMKVLAHELAHTVEFALVDGGPALWDHWLSEGFAEWARRQSP